MTRSTAFLDTWFPGTEKELQALRGQVQNIRFGQGQTVFHRGDLCRNYLVVTEGCVRVQALSQSGRDVVLYRVTDGQSCVITTSCLISRETYPAEGVTEQDTAALVIPRATFNEALGCSVAFRHFVFTGQGQRLSDLIQRVEDVAFGRVDMRLAKHLLDRCLNSSGLITVTHQQLASELGTAREVVSRQLKVFEKSGWIAVRRGAVEVLQPQAIASLLDSSR